MFENISEYDFGSDLSVNILGHVFEQSISDIEEFKSELLGKALDKNSGKRKKNGIFYTPPYITHFIISKTINEWLNEQKEKLGFSKLPVLPAFDKKMSAQQKGAYTKALNTHIKFWEDYQDVLRNIKILDPACASGAFLVSAFDFLFEEGKKVNNELSELKGGLISLFDLDKHILKNNLFGIDINRESIEITKLSLWIKTANKFDPLTSLDNNICYGDSLVDEVFPEESFDIVLGNPPYVRQELITHLKPDLEMKYKVYHSSLDLFGYFYEKSLYLLKKDGYIGFISNSFSKTNSSIYLREFLVNNSRFIYYVDFTGVQIFEGATTYPVVMVLKKDNQYKKNLFRYYKINKEELNTLSSHFEERSILINQNQIDNSNWDFVSEEEQNLKKRLFSSKTIKEKFGKTYYGLKTGLNKAFIIDKSVYELLTVESSELMVPYLEGKDLTKWSIGKVDKWLIYIQKGWTKKTFGENLTEESAKELMIKKYPLLFNHLLQFKKEAIKRYDKGDFWWELRSCDYIEKFKQTKICWPNLQNAPKFLIDDTYYFLNAPAVMLSTNEKWLLGVLNSSLSWYILKSLCVVRNGGYIEVKPQFFDKFPLPILKQIPLDLENKVDEIMELNKKIENNKVRFIEYFQSEFSLSKTSKKLNNFYHLDFKEFTKELVKQTVILTQQDKYELMGVFNTESEKINSSLNLLSKLEKELDELVFILYKISDKEKNVIKNII
ncbi:Eco57I restriction-modification methylase domain-containing protein [Bacillus toyonensis]|uniref:site-specific DNA-methyltransferase (adenine-specific) n=1 Tax=Bacillus toyonensis TaxID=155322 RepID=A0A2B5Y1B5_9BACI|nr:N-6 DNA methylase [Bacillus toyonensis]PGB02052.1 hypothetical protein COL93_13585 [Bacillus toyonensis]PHD63339.1 hypothetical protein COF40_25250 [Bacillus toyonensis]